jgi:multidrug efflux system membrane fusion protein
MNRIFAILIVIAAVAFGFWWKAHNSGAKPAEPPKPPEEEGIKITHDTNGNVVLQIPDEIQGNAGITVSQPVRGEFSPEIKAFGRVVDTAPLSAAFAELQAARIAADYSRQEFERMKTLKSQNNASERAFQQAQEASVRDQTALNLALVKIRPVWGDKIADRLSASLKADNGDQQEDKLLSSFATGKSVLVRVDLPGGEAIDLDQIKAARLAPLSQSAPIDAEYFGLVPNVDPQTQGRGLFFLVSDNKTHLGPGAAVTAFIQLSGAPVSGVIIPPEAVVRTEGAGWVYVMSAGSDKFTRTEISLEHPVENGWFVPKNLSTNNYVVTTGAQSILSQETKPAGAPD